MPLSIDERIATNGLLMEREAAYARVSEIEGAINQLLQGEYPFPVPDSVPPSCMKRKPPKAQRGTKAPRKKPAIKLRRLKETEVAYRYSWLENGEEKEATTIESRLIDTFVKSPPEGVRILKIDTIDIDGNLVESLYAS